MPSGAPEGWLSFCAQSIVGHDQAPPLTLHLNSSFRACVLNSELPLNSRRHIVEQYNKGIYDIIIAADEVKTGKAGHGLKNRAKVKHGVVLSAI